MTVTTAPSMLHDHAMLLSCIVHPCHGAQLKCATRRFLSTCETWSCTNEAHSPIMQSAPRGAAAETWNCRDQEGRCGHTGAKVMATPTHPPSCPTELPPVFSHRAFAYLCCRLNRLLRRAAQRGSSLPSEPSDRWVLCPCESKAALLQLPDGCPSGLQLNRRAHAWHLPLLCNTCGVDDVRGEWPCGLMREHAQSERREQLLGLRVRLVTCHRYAQGWEARGETKAGESAHRCSSTTATTTAMVIGCIALAEGISTD